MDLGLYIGKHFIPKSIQPRVLRFAASIPINPFSNSVIAPRRLTYLYGGGGVDRQIGNRWFQLLREGGLRPSDKVLEVGCGTGRMAIPLTTYLNKAQRGSYDGFDIVPYGIRFCQKRITPRFPHFHFQLADIYSRFYNPKGRYKASEYRFPFHDNAFDVVFLTSVFTHMLTKDMEHYTAEISRVLKPGGKSFITYFLLNDETRNFMTNATAKIAALKVSDLDFRYKVDERCLSIGSDPPERGTAYEEGYILELYRSYDLNLIQPIRYGLWRVNKSLDETLKLKYQDYQDMIIAVKDEK